MHFRYFAELYYLFKGHAEHLSATRIIYILWWWGTFLIDIILVTITPDWSFSLEFFFAYVDCRVCINTLLQIEVIQLR